MAKGRLAGVVGAMLLMAGPVMAPAPTAANTDDAAAASAVQRHVDAYESGSLDAFVATFTPDATVVGNGMIAKGRTQIRALYAANFVPDAPTIRITESGMNGEKVYLRVAYDLDDGSSVCCSYSEYTVRNGKIAYLVAVG